ncbi:hypothetical protein WJX77_001065 [Trebouxia sp. C0004]
MSRLQRLVAAVTRLSLRQRTQLVFEGYRARFAKIGAITSGDLEYLKQADLMAMQLPPIALDTMEWLETFGLGICPSLFHKQDLHTMQDVPMLSEEDILSWQGRFKQGKPFRKLKKLLASVRLNLWAAYMAGSDQSEAGRGPAETQDLFLVEEQKAVAVLYQKAALDKLDWTQQAFCGDAWKQSVQAALKQISIEDYYKMSNQRFPQALSSLGIYAAGRGNSAGGTEAHLASAHVALADFLWRQYGPSKVDPISLQRKSPSRSTAGQLAAACQASTILQHA